MSLSTQVQLAASNPKARRSALSVQVHYQPRQCPRPSQDFSPRLVPFCTIVLVCQSVARQSFSWVRYPQPRLLRCRGYTTAVQRELGHLIIGGALWLFLGQVREFEATCCPPLRVLRHQRVLASELALLLYPQIFHGKLLCSVQAFDG